MSQVTVRRWRNSLAVPLPGEIIRDAGLSDGESVDVSVQGQSIVNPSCRSALDLDELFKGKSPEEWRAAYADAYDWGPDVGREIVEE